MVKLKDCEWFADDGTQLFRIGENLHYDDRKRLGVSVKEGWHSDYLGPNKCVAGIATGEKRPPKKGEWYLSGAPVNAWRAPNDLTTSFYIAKLVKVKITTRTSVEVEVESEQLLS